MRLVILHYHFRPGGVRRVIELATPHLVRKLQPKVTELVLACDRSPDLGWLATFRSQVGSCKVRVRVLPELGYFAEQKHNRSAIRERLRIFFSDLLGVKESEDCVVWAHNQSLGRNLSATRELVESCAAQRRLLMLHHHDWWFDNRWQRWSEMRECGATSLKRVARILLPVAPLVRHIAINRADARILERHLPGRVAWIPNLSESAKAPTAVRTKRARAWLSERIGEAAPIWLVPTRLLRRKNLAEALLITRWLRPEAWLVTTAGVSSDSELTYAARLQRACKAQGWRLSLGILQKDVFDAPSVAELMAGSEVILLSSLQEGFGLPYLEAASASRPLIARKLSNIAPDLTKFGFQFPQSYEEIWIDTRLYDVDEEEARCRTLFGKWRRLIPGHLRSSVSRPDWQVARGKRRMVPFSRLSLDAQLEVLGHPSEFSWKLCAPLNPALSSWRQSAKKGELKVSPWPRKAADWLGGDAYARRWMELLKRRPGKLLHSEASAAAQMEFIRAKFAPDNQYPLLWSAGV